MPGAGEYLDIMVRLLCLVLPNWDNNKAAQLDPTRW